MINKKLSFSLLVTLTLVSFSACGSNDSANAPIPNVSASPTTNTNNDEVLQKLDQIAQDLAGVKTKINDLGTITSSTTTVGIKPTKTPVDVKGTKPISSSTPAPVVDNKDKYRKVLDNIISTINSANYMQADVDKFERHLDDGKTSTNKLIMYAKKGGLVKIESIDSSIAANIGVKLSYNSGDAVGKVKIRPSGALSLITTSLDKTDKRISTYNGYILDEIDMFGMAKRFADPGYVAELAGKTKVGNDDVYILKVTHKTQNTLDPRIKYEYIGFEPKTFYIRLWQAFDDPQKDAFFNMTLNSFKILDNIPDSNFSV
ncbi:MAG: hypothetical protein H7263_12255 [Candidatus Sericytochromatia bacterium]|nr:hypothetical protein [Candidatus Sericytochromatia bacterium]